MALQRSIALSILLIALLPASGYAADPSESEHPRAAPPPILEDIAVSSGLDFVHFNGMSGELYFSEMTGQGGGLFDMDNDGDLDVYLVQGSMLGHGKTLDDALLPPRDDHPRDRLFRNELTVGSKGERLLRFVDVTDRSGIRMTGYGMGVACGDFNNDGWVDLYVTNVGANRMLFNNGDGTFSDRTEESGTGDTQWGTSAGVFDYDLDGWLDLYVANYVDFDIVKNAKCFAKSSRRDYCGPSTFPPQRDRLFHNTGNGIFEDVTEKALVGYRPWAGLGVVAIDPNGDGWPDIYVANDGNPNQLWISRAGKVFEDDGLVAGAALNQHGRAEASMGVTAGDFDGDGDEDLFLTHIMGETNTLYCLEGSGFFEDFTLAAGLSAASFPYTAFGVGWIDYDNDGWLDLLVVNGAVLIIEQQLLDGDSHPLHQPNQLFHNEGGKRFTDVTALAGADLALSEVSRGAAFGDVDNDGDIDVLVCNNAGRARLLQNNIGDRYSWLGLRLVGSKTKRDMLGTTVTLHRKGKPTLLRRVRTSGSYCSANDPRLVFGLDASDAVDTVTVHWPGGDTEVWREPVPGQYTTLVQGAIGNEDEHKNEDAKRN